MEKMLDELFKAYFFGHQRKIVWVQTVAKTRVDEALVTDVVLVFFCQL